MPRINALLQTNEDLKNEAGKKETIKLSSQPYSIDQLKLAWNEFAEKRKLYKAEYQLLTQEIEIQENNVLVHLHNPVQETLLNDLKMDITSFIREKLENYTIQVTGLLKSHDDKKVVYTNREKFDHLAEKNPYLKELKEKLGLDPDF